MNNKPYFSMLKKNSTAVINIFGDITSTPWLDSDVSAYKLSEVLDNLSDVEVVNVYINSYGGEVAEGLAIYNSLKRLKAKVITHIDGFACSIASVIFMAGEERIMPKTSCLIIHNPFTRLTGNAEQLRKEANNLDKISTCSIAAYMERVNITEEELKKLLNNETWISSSEATQMGFATKEIEEDDTTNPSQSIKGAVAKKLMSKTDEENSETLINQNKLLDEKENVINTLNAEINKLREKINKEEEEKNQKIKEERINDCICSFFNKIEREFK